MPYTKMNIPGTINVGYQSRTDTYTGKLAYVVYTDQKNVLRKAASWNSWRDDKIPTNDFPNVPTSGFVLNKKVGGYKSDWNVRQTAIRIYDPRDFEFEIKVDNLLYILEECSSIKGKGLEGEFVYAWEGKDLILLPVTSQEYKSSQEFTSMKSMKVAKKDMKEGCLYVTKEMEKVIYLGKHELFEKPYSYSNDDQLHKSIGQKQVFAYPDKKIEKDPEHYSLRISNGKVLEKYWIQDGFAKLAKKVSDDVDPNYADLFDEFKQSIIANQCNKIEINVKPMTEQDVVAYSHYNRNRIVKVNNKYYGVEYRPNYTKYPTQQYNPVTRNYTSKDYEVKDVEVRYTSIFHIDEANAIVKSENIERRGSQYWDRTTSQYKYTSLTVNAPDDVTKSMEEILATEHFTIQLVNKFGNAIKLY